MKVIDKILFFGIAGMFFIALAYLAI